MMKKTVQLSNLGMGFRAAIVMIHSCQKLRAGSGTQIQFLWPKDMTSVVLVYIQHYFIHVLFGMVRFECHRCLLAADIAFFNLAGAQLLIG